MCASFVGQSHGEAGVEKGNGEITRIAALVASARVWRKADQTTVSAVFEEGGQVPQPGALHLFGVSAFVRLAGDFLGFLLHAWVGHHGDGIERVGDIGPGKLWMSEKHERRTGAHPYSDNPLRMERGHHISP